MELREYWNMLKRWWWLMVACVLISAGASYIGTLGMPRIYQATTTVMVGQTLQQTNPTSSDMYISQQLAQTYAQMVQRSPILEGAKQALGLAFTPAASSVSTRLVLGTQLLEISARDTDPERARRLADEIAKQLILRSPTGREETERQTFIHQRLKGLEANMEHAEQEIAEEQEKLEAASAARAIQQHQANIDALVQKLSSYEFTYASFLQSVQAGTNYIAIFEHASFPYSPISPNVTETVLFAVAIGLGLAVGGAVLIEFLDDAVKSPEEATRLTQLPILGAIARMGGDVSVSKLIVHEQPASTVAEAYRVLRTNVRLSFIDRPMRTLMVTSPAPSEAKSVTLANLAVAIAQSGLRVILVDTDLRRPILHKILNASNTEGLSNILLAPELELDAYLQETAVENLRFLSCGPLPPNPAEVLGSERMGMLIDMLLGAADLVLFDSPPVLVVTDAIVLASRMQEGGVLVVVDIGETRRGMAKRAVEELQRVQINMLGLIANWRSRRAGGEYHYQYYRDYTKSPDSKRKQFRYRLGLAQWLPKFLNSKAQDTAKLVEAPLEEPL